MPFYRVAVLSNSSPMFKYYLFFFIAGDLLLCEIISELDERSPNLFGDTVCFKNIKPLRSKLVLGEVTLWRDELAIGIINNEISFSAESCSAGYKPHVKDKVTKLIILRSTYMARHSQIMWDFLVLF